MAIENGERLSPGFWLETASPVACEIAAYVGYRFILLDMEHGVISAEEADRLIPYCKALGFTVYSRIAAVDRVPIQRALDSGADGLIISQIDNARHARETTVYAKYPPLGTRGMGYGRSSNYGSTGPDFVEAENGRIRCYAMIETAGALAEVDAIATLDTVDGLFLGPADLSLSRGRGPYRGTPEDNADALRIAKAAKAAAKPWAMPALTAERARFAAEHGAAFITISDDRSAMIAGASQALEIARGTYL